MSCPANSACVRRRHSEETIPQQQIQQQQAPRQPTEKRNSRAASIPPTTPTRLPCRRSSSVPPAPPDEASSVVSSCVARQESSSRPMSAPAYQQHVHVHHRLGHPEGYTCSHERPFFIPAWISLQREDDKVARVIAVILLLLLIVVGIVRYFFKPQDEHGDIKENPDTPEPATTLPDEEKGLSFISNDLIF